MSVRTGSRRLRLGLVALVMALLAVPAVAGASSKDLRYVVSQPLGSQQWGSDRCSPYANVWLQEVGKSGVTRLRARYEIRGPYDPGYLPTWGRSYYAFGRFPNDARSFWGYFPLRVGVHTFGNGRRVAVWVKLIGERPSFWQPDRTAHLNLGELECYISDPTITSGRNMGGG